MLSNQSLPKKADIFKQSTSSRRLKLYYKPFTSLKKIGLIVMSVLFLLAAVFLLPSSFVSTHNGSVKQAEMPWKGQHTHNWNQDNNPDNTSAPASVGPFPSIDTTSFSPIQQQVPPPEPSINQPNGQDIGGASAQILNTQQQITNQMQTCIANANNMADQIKGLMSQQKDLQSQLDTLNNQPAPTFDTSTPQGQQQQQAWQQQQQQNQQKLQTAIDNLSTTINDDQNTFNDSNSKCQQQVSAMEQNREQQESDLDTDFGNAMNIQFPQ